MGTILTNDLKWSKNTDYITRKAMSKLWMIRRLKGAGLSSDELLDFYNKEVRSLLEMAVPVWHSSLTIKQTNQIERVQKAALSIVLEGNYTSYEVACTLTNREPLYIRRENICLKFAKKNLESKSPLLTALPIPSRTRQTGKVVHEYFCRTTAFSKSSLPYLAKLVNSELPL